MDVVPVPLEPQSPFRYRVHLAADEFYILIAEHGLLLYRNVDALPHRILNDYPCLGEELSYRHYEYELQSAFINPASLLAHVRHKSELTLALRNIHQVEYFAAQLHCKRLSFHIFRVKTHFTYVFREGRPLPEFTFTVFNLYFHFIPSFRNLFVIFFSFSAYSIFTLYGIAAEFQHHIGRLMWKSRFILRYSSFFPFFAKTSCLSPA